MSSPTSTPGRRKRNRDDIPATPKSTAKAGSDGLVSPPSQRRRGQDSSNGDLPAMPTSPGTDIASPAVHDTSLFSSPRRSGN
ncbi:unnamed protein product [Oncorhynchus mykiss]|uniref:Uncharacterized protein n=1 Tax=Oncorhynchus mykiss TaxID=8022 RepID=A0A060Z654_ONCMY|nr:unnamed protein product [Oncorhynchus mykiss]